MPKTFITNQIEGQAAVVEHTWDDIQAEAASHRRSRVIVESWSEEREWSDGQRKWWKGVLLPALAEHTDNSELYWENKLKLAVMPDDFTPQRTVIDVEEYWYLPSVSTLSMKKMNKLIVGSVAHLRDEDSDEIVYGDEFLWVTLPAKQLRNNNVRTQEINKDVQQGRSKPCLAVPVFEVRDKWLKAE